MSDRIKRPYSQAEAVLLHATSLTSIEVLEQLKAERDAALAARDHCEAANVALRQQLAQATERADSNRRRYELGLDRINRQGLHISRLHRQGGGLRADQCPDCAAQEIETTPFDDHGHNRRCGACGAIWHIGGHPPSRVAELEARVADLVLDEGDSHVLDNVMATIGKHCQEDEETINALDRILDWYSQAYESPTAVDAMRPLHAEIKRLRVVSGDERRKRHALEARTDLDLTKELLARFALTSVLDNPLLPNQWRTLQVYDGSRYLVELWFDGEGRAVDHKLEKNDRTDLDVIRSILERREIPVRTMRWKNGHWLEEVSECEFVAGFRFDQNGTLLNIEAAVPS